MVLAVSRKLNMHCSVLEPSPSTAFMSLHTCQGHDACCWFTVTTVTIVKILHRSAVQDTTTCEIVAVLWPCASCCMIEYTSEACLRFYVFKSGLLKKAVALRSIAVSRAGTLMLRYTERFHSSTSIHIFPN